MKKCSDKIIIASLIAAPITFLLLLFILFIQRSPFNNPATHEEKPPDSVKEVPEKNNEQYPIKFENIAINFIFLNSPTPIPVYTFTGIFNI